MELDPHPLKLGLRPAEVAAALGSEQIYREMVAAKWITPIIQRKGLTLYDRGHVASAWARILRGEEIPKMPTGRPAANK